MDTYGDILKKRIKEMGYTQEEFAETVRVPFGTLKKYLSNKSVYPIDLLKIFAEKLDCSYDYLMGDTISPQREYQDLKDVTRLSDKAIDRLKYFGSVYNNGMGADCASDAISKMLEMENLVESVVLYFYADSRIMTGMEELMREVEQSFSPNVEVKKSSIAAESLFFMAVSERFAKCKIELGE